TSGHIIHIMLNDTHGKPEGLVERTHPFGVTPSQIIVDRDHMHSVTDKTIEVYWQCRDECFPFTSFHLSDFPFMQHDAPNELDIKMAHVEQTSGYFAHDCKSFRNQAVEGSPLVKALAKQRRLGLQLIE